MVAAVGIFIFTKVASTFTLVVLLLCLFTYLIVVNAKQHALSLLLATFALFTSVIAAKEYFQIARPINSLVETSGYAFPSGHAAGVVFLAIVVAFLTRQLSSFYRYCILFTCILVVGMISYSRIILHVHTWSQVFAGMSFGIVCGVIFIYFATRK